MVYYKRLNLNSIRYLLLVIFLLFITFYTFWASHLFAATPKYKEGGNVKDSSVAAQGDKRAGQTVGIQHYTDNNTYIMAEETHPNFTGQWKLTKQEKFDEFLAANDVNWMMRKMVGSAKPTVDIFHNGDSLMIRTGAGPMSREEEFTVGEEYQHRGPVGVEKGLAKWIGQKLVTVMTDPAGKKPQKTITRELLCDNEMLVTMQMRDIEAKRWFQKSNT